MSRSEPVLLLVAAPDRAGIVAALRRFRAMSADELAGMPLRGPSSSGPERMAIVAGPTTVHERIDLALQRLPALTAPRLVVRGQGLYFSNQPTPGRVAFLFPGQGSEHVGMLQTLRERMPAVKVWFDTLDRAAAALSQPPLTPLIDSRSIDRDAVDARAGSARRGLFDMERGGQLGTTADLALHEVALALGLRADVHVGHSKMPTARFCAAASSVSEAPGRNFPRRSSPNGCSPSACCVRAGWPLCHAEGKTRAIWPWTTVRIRW
jgi:acyl transferase domain-containing protein